MPKRKSKAVKNSRQRLERSQQFCALLNLHERFLNSTERNLPWHHFSFLQKIKIPTKFLRFHRVIENGFHWSPPVKNLDNCVIQIQINNAISQGTSTVIKIGRFQPVAKYTDNPSQSFHDFVSRFKVDQYFNSYNIILTQKLLSHQDTLYYM